MNTFLNIGYVNYLKEFDKCYMFSFSILPKKKVYVECIEIISGGNKASATKKATAKQEKKNQKKHRR